MKKKLFKLLPIIFVLATMIGLSIMMSVPASAAHKTWEVRNYNELISAFENYEMHDTIKLMNNITEGQTNNDRSIVMDRSEYMIDGKHIVAHLDLNGYTLSKATTLYSDEMFHLRGDVILEVSSSKAGGKIEFTAYSDDAKLFYLESSHSGLRIKPGVELKVNTTHTNNACGIYIDNQILPVKYGPEDLFPDYVTVQGAKFSCANAIFDRNPLMRLYIESTEFVGENGSVVVRVDKRKKEIKNVSIRDITIDEGKMEISGINTAEEFQTVFKNRYFFVGENAYDTQKDPVNNVKNAVLNAAGSSGVLGKEYHIITSDSKYADGFPTIYTNLTSLVDGTPEEKPGYTKFTVFTEYAPELQELDGITRYCPGKLSISWRRYNDKGQGELLPEFNDRTSIVDYVPNGTGKWTYCCYIFVEYKGRTEYKLSRDMTVPSFPALDESEIKLKYTGSDVAATKDKRATIAITKNSSTAKITGQFLLIGPDFTSINTSDIYSTPAPIAGLSGLTWMVKKPNSESYEYIQNKDGTQFHGNEYKLSIDTVGIYQVYVFYDVRLNPMSFYSGEDYWDKDEQKWVERWNTQSFDKEEGGFKRVELLYDIIVLEPPEFDVSLETDETKSPWSSSYGMYCIPQGSTYDYPITCNAQVTKAAADAFYYSWQYYDSNNSKWLDFPKSQNDFVIPGYGTFDVLGANTKYIILNCDDYNRMLTIRCKIMAYAVGGTGFKEFYGYSEYRDVWFTELIAPEVVQDIDSEYNYKLGTKNITLSVRGDSIALGSCTYQWQTYSGYSWVNIADEVYRSIKIDTTAVGSKKYRCIIRNPGNLGDTAVSTEATVNIINDTPLTATVGDLTINEGWTKQASTVVDTEKRTVVCYIGEQIPFNFTASVNIPAAIVNKSVFIRGKKLSSEYNSSTGFTFAANQIGTFVIEGEYIATYYTETVNINAKNRENFTYTVTVLPSAAKGTDDFSVSVFSGSFAFVEYKGTIRDRITNGTNIVKTDARWIIDGNDKFNALNFTGENYRFIRGYKLYIEVEEEIDGVMQKVWKCADVNDAFANLDTAVSNITRILNAQNGTSTWLTLETRTEEGAVIPVEQYGNFNAYIVVTYMPIINEYNESGIDYMVTGTEEYTSEIFTVTVLPPCQHEVVRQHISTFPHDGGKGISVYCSILCMECKETVEEKIAIIGEPYLGEEANYDMLHFEVLAPTPAQAGHIEHWKNPWAEEYFVYDPATMLYSTVADASTLVIPCDMSKLVHHEYLASTCTTAGNFEHYTHPDCEGKQYTLLENGTYEEFDAVIPPSHKLQTTRASEPTCVTDGNSEYHTCSGCGKHFADVNATIEIIDLSTTVLAKTGVHSYEWVVDIPATKTQKGIKHEECTVCKAKRSENTEIDILPCDHAGKVKTEEVKATCATAGKKAYWHCADCDKYFSDEACMLEISDLSTFGIIAATGVHSYEWVVDIPATKTQKGIKHEECTVCNAKRSENTEIDILACDHAGKVKTEAVEATCATAGKKAYWHCADCDKYFSDEACMLEISDLSTFGIIGATGVHSYEWVIDKAPGFGVKGEKHEECTVCHERRSNGTEIAALTYSVDISADGNTAIVTVDGDFAVGVDIKEAIAANPGKAIEIKIGTSGSILFDAKAAAQLAAGDVMLVVKEGNKADYTGAELVLEITLNNTGITFTDGGKATVTYAFTKAVPEGKVAKVFYVNGTEKTDMNATFAEGKVTFETDHFSTYVIEFVDKEGTDPGTVTPGTQTPGTQTPGTETPGTETPGTNPNETVKDGLPVGAVVAIIVVGVLAVGVGGFSIFWFVIKKKKFADLIAVFKKIFKK